MGGPSYISRGKSTKRMDGRIGKDRPALMTAADGHSAWANSKALEVSGVTKDTPDPIRWTH